MFQRPNAIILVASPRGSEGSEGELRVRLGAMGAKQRGPIPIGNPGNQNREYPVGCSIPVCCSMNMENG